MQIASPHPAPVIPIPPPMLLSLRTSDRCHWRGNPSPPHFEPLHYCHSEPARRLAWESVPLTSDCPAPVIPTPPRSCHCEPVTDVTGAAIRPLLISDCSRSCHSEPARRLARQSVPSSLRTAPLLSFRASPQAGVGIRSPRRGTSVTSGKSQGFFHQIQKEVTFCGLLHGADA